MFLDSIEITGSCALNPPSHPAVSQHCALHPPSPLNGACSLLDALVHGRGQGQTQIQLLVAQKASPWETSVGGKGKAALSWSPETREDDGMMSEDIPATSWETKVLKAGGGRGLPGACSAHAQFSDWLTSRWSFEHLQSSGFNWSGVYVLVVTSFYLVGI